MCGIAGIYTENNSLKININQMLLAMKHRGPDGSGTFEDNKVILGHNRLSIIDTSNAGSQPMHSACKRYTIVLNGEIYNYKELKSLVPDHIQLKSQTDTEILLELWAKEQHKCIAKLRGMFAFAIWDHELHTLDLVRDHLGIKPLYYYHNGTSFAFASECKGIIKSYLFKPSVNKQALQQYLMLGYVMQPATLLQDVCMLPPSSYLTFKEDNFTITSYWHITDPSLYQCNNEQDAIKKTRELISDIVLEETVSDRPLGIFLSGGLDSSILVAALREKGIQQISTFSVGFDDNELSEENEAQAIANFFKTNHTQIQVSDTDVAPYIDEYINAIDMPSVDGLNTWLVSKTTAQHVTVALSGLGGDELFSGYGIDRKIIYKNKFSIFYAILHASAFIIKKFPEKMRNRLAVYASWHKLGEWYAQWGKVFSLSEIEALTGNTTTNIAIFNKTDLGKKYNILQRISYLHLRGFMMSRLLRDSDAVSMSNSLEVRFPLIDHRLVSFVWSLPLKWKIKDVARTARLKNYEVNGSYEHNRLKHLLYQAFKPILPPDFGFRPKKGFKIPIDKWMRASLEDDIKATLLNNNSFFSKSELELIWEKWQRKEIHWNKVWTIYMFEKWHKKNIG